ncbi:MAG TPA: SH3 domain-containing protein, partial [Polyangiaceae bacterium]|nr:SH3 domain-containing protein [Polyangiaceae bacterium]
LLSLGMYLDFSRGHIAKVKAGQSTTLSKEQTAKLVGCAEENVVGTALDGVAHEQARYWVYYVVRLLPAGSPVGSPPAAEVVSASGQATVGWQTAIVREGPSSQAHVAARLAHGTRVSVTGRAGDWYRIARSGKVMGWVHREALGL